MHVTMLTRRRVKRGLCLGLGCYALFLLVSLGAWRHGHDQRMDLKPERRGRAALSHHHHVEDADEDADDQDQDPQDGQEVMLPETLDTVRRQQPGAQAARKKLSKPEPRQINVVVEDAPPGTFVRHYALEPEGNSHFRDLRPKVGDENVHPLDRWKAARGGENVQSMSLPSVMAAPREEAVPEKDDSGAGDSDPVEEDSREKSEGGGGGVWLAPDGTADDLTQVSADAETPVVGAEKETDPRSPAALRVSSEASRTAATFNVSVSRATANFQELADVTIYSAFYDDRLSVPLVRMLAIGPISRRPSASSLWCVFAAESSEPAPVSVRQTADCQRMKKYCFYMLHCEVTSCTIIRLLVALEGYLYLFFFFFVFIFIFFFVVVVVVVFDSP